MSMWSGSAAPARRPAPGGGGRVLPPPVEDLFLAGELGDVGPLDPGLAQRRRGAAGGEDLDPERRQRFAEVGDAGLVGDRDEGAADADRVVRARRGGGVAGGVGGGLAHRSATVGRSSSPILALPPASVRIASGNSSCS